MRTVWLPRAVLHRHIRLPSEEPRVPVLLRLGNGSQHRHEEDDSQLWRLAQVRPGKKPEQQSGSRRECTEQRLEYQSWPLHPSRGLTPANSEIRHPISGCHRGLSHRDSSVPQLLAHCGTTSRPFCHAQAVVKPDRFRRPTRHALCVSSPVP